MGKNIDAAYAFLAKEAEVGSLYLEVKARGWNIGNIGTIPSIDYINEEHIAFLKRLRDSEKVIDTGKVRMHAFPGKDCEVAKGYIKIGVEASIDEIIKFLEE